MSLSPGTRLGPYQVTARIGVGGMGEVYRARDIKLGRDVALKVLPDLFVRDRERRTRFEREAQVLASLNHPHIAQIYGLEEADGVRALVLELVEGPTLADRIAEGPIPLDEALPIARQITDALKAAHEHGIIHRDLKPVNIKLRPDGTVKVLDFGLAKLAESPGAPGTGAVTGAGGFPGAGGADGGTGLPESPTITSPATLTGAGMILGTAAYMAPEQAKGRPADKRSDIWAFGCVLYEMLTGKRAFEGENVSETLAAVLRDEPDWTALPSGVSPAIRAVVQRCLAKDRRRRIADISVTEFLLTEDVALAPLASTPTAPPFWRRAWPVAATLGISATIATGATWLAMRPVAPQVTRTMIATTGPAALTIGASERDVAIAPDGRHIVYVGNNGTQLFVRALDALEPVAIATGANLRAPFLSPDGQWVGFSEDGTTLRKVALTGGPPITLAGLDGQMRGATWAPDGTIIFATISATGLQRVSAAGGGTPEVLTSPDRAAGESDHVWPEMLPGGGAVLFTIMAPSGADAAQIAVRDLRSGMQTIVVRGGSHAHHVRSGHLIYTVGGTLRAVGFDLSRLETRGTAASVVPHVATTRTGSAEFAVAADGTLIYVDAQGGASAGRTLAWVDRSGKEEPLGAPPRMYTDPRLSPDGRRVAVHSQDEQQDIWIWDVPRATLTRLTAEPTTDSLPVWTPDGQRIVFTSGRGGGALNLWWQAADGTGAAERLTTSSNNPYATGFTPDGRHVVFNEVTRTMQRDLLRLSLDEPRRVTPLLQTPFDERNGTVSPDGRWLAYESNSSGRSEIYVRPLSDPDSGLWQVSSTGGTQPLFAPSGTELFFLGPAGALMRVPVEASGTTWSAGTPVPIFDRGYMTGPLARSYDVSPDGRRFLMIKGVESDVNTAPSNLIVVQHFDEELKRLVATP